MDNPAIREFDEIRPYEPGEMRQAFDELINDRQFQLILKGFVPWLPKGLRNGLLKLAYAGIKTPLDFQLRFMKPVVKYIIRKHTDGCTFDDSELHAGPDARFTFISNHRDIVLDSAFLDVMLIDSGYPTTVEIGIGDNLLIYPWIKRLVRMNKAFTVRRSLSPKEMLRSSQLMSRYIHFAVTQKKENIWIAQREGRAKDSNDRTQDSVLKMLAMGAPDEIKNPADRLRDLNIVPLTISYEFDPCDYLKAQEMQEKRDIAGFHRGYQLFPCNYIALDELNGNTANASHYTEAEKKRFENYLDRQLAKITIPNKDEVFLRSCMLNMYANPLRNKIAAE